MSSAEAARRLAQVGPNEIAEQRRSVVLEFLGHFWGPIAWMIEAAVVLTAVVGRWADFAIILVLLLMNGLVGFWEEHQAGNAIAALKSQLAVSARVLRDGQWQSLPARLLVPGDVIHVDLGQIVPADAEVNDGSAQVDQSTLTGESLPAKKVAGDEHLFGVGDGARGVDRDGDRDGAADVVWSHGGAGWRGAAAEPFPAGGAFDRPLSDRACAVAGFGDRGGVAASGCVGFLDA